jgi:hypothetical protein
MSIETTTTVSLFTGYRASSRACEVGDIILLGVTWGGVTWQYPAMVASVTSSGPDEVEVFGKGPSVDFEFFPQGSCEASYAYAGTATNSANATNAAHDRTNLADMEWIFAKP